MKAKGKNGELEMPNGCSESCDLLAFGGQWDLPVPLAQVQSADIHSTSNLFHRIINFWHGIQVSLTDTIDFPEIQTKP